MKLSFSILILVFFSVSIFSVQNRSVFNRKKSFDSRYKQMVELSEILPFEKVSTEITQMKELMDQITSSFTPKGDPSQAGKYLSQGEKQIGSLEIDYVDFIQTDSKEFLKLAYNLVLQAEIQKKEELKQKLKKEPPKESSQNTQAEKAATQEQPKQDPVTETPSGEKVENAPQPETPKETTEDNNSPKKIKPRGKPARYLEMAKQEHSTASRFQKTKQYFLAISYYKRSILYSLLAITSSNAAVPEKYKLFYDKWLKKEAEEETTSPSGAKPEKSNEVPAADSGGNAAPVENPNQNQENQGESQ